MIPASAYKTNDGRNRRGFSQKSQGSFLVLTSCLAVSVIHEMNTSEERDEVKTWYLLPSF